MSLIISHFQCHDFAGCKCVRVRHISNSVSGFIFTHLWFSIVRLCFASLHRLTASPHKTINFNRKPHKYEYLVNYCLLNRNSWSYMNNRLKSHMPLFKWILPGWAFVCVSARTNSERVCELVRVIRKADSVIQSQLASFGKWTKYWLPFANRQSF